MGYMKHHAIVVTGEEPAIRNAFREVDDFAHAAIAVQITELTPETMNGQRSFMVAPDGSKVEWPDSDDGNRARQEIVDILKCYSYNADSSPLKWVEVMFGDDEGRAVVVRHSGEWQ